MLTADNSTEADDRGEKFRQYPLLESLQEFVLVSQVSPCVETFTRQGDGRWRLAMASGPEGTVKLDSLKIEVPLSEVYSGVEFPPEPEVLQAL